MESFDEPLLDIELPPGPPLEKVYDFYVTVAGGLEDLVVAEIKQRLGKVSDLKVIRGRRLSRVFFHYERSPRKLLELRTVDRVYALLANVSGITVGQPGLLKIAQTIGQVDLIPSAVLHDILYGVKDEVGFRLSCTTGKGHRFSASEVHHIVQTVLTMKYEVDDGVDRPYVLHLRVEGNRALFGLQLVTQKEREANYLIQVRGDLQPSVAHCLAKLLRLRRNDKVLDLRCGGGQTLIEAGLANMQGRFIGMDYFSDIAQGFLENAQQTQVQVNSLVGEGAVLPFANASLNKVFGNLIPRSGSPPIPLFQLFSELVRVIVPDGQALLIYEDRKAFQRMLDDFPRLKVLKRRPLHLQGKHLDLYILLRK